MSAKLQVDKYYQSLQRLIDRGAVISNDTVAMEAGSGRGSIKKSRAAYGELIGAIQKAASEQSQAKAKSDPTPALRKEKALLVQLLDSALEREVALLHEIYYLREELRQSREHAFNKGLAVIKTPRENPRS